jgi:hypothetical protein
MIDISTEAGALQERSDGSSGEPSKVFKSGLCSDAQSESEIMTPSLSKTMNGRTNMHIVSLSRNLDSRFCILILTNMAHTRQYVALTYAASAAALPFVTAQNPNTRPTERQSKLPLSPFISLHPPTHPPTLSRLLARHCGIKC